VKKEHQIFLGFLKEKNLKLTSQRESILEAFLGQERHLSVEELYGIIKRRDPGIGQTTVFRTMKLLCEVGIAKETTLGDKIVRYEHKYGHEHHDHLVCVKCGRYIEAMDPHIEKAQDALCRKFSFQAEKHKMEIFGICKACKTKMRNT